MTFQNFSNQNQILIWECKSIKEIFQMVSFLDNHNKNSKYKENNNYLMRIPMVQINI